MRKAAQVAHCQIRTPANFISMSTESLSVMVGGEQRSFELIYISTHGYGIAGKSELAHFHHVRQFPSMDWRKITKDYETRVLPRAISLFVDALAGRSFDVLLRPPSTRDDAVPYHRAAAEELKIPRDWSENLTRDLDVSAGQTRSCDALYSALAFIAPAEISEVRSVLMVDESFTYGTTACAVWRRLLEAGLSFKCEFTVAAPLRIIPDPTISQAP